MLKKLLTIFLSIISLTLMAQVPQGVGYQGVATDVNGIELVNQSISIRASVLSGSATGTIEWEETHATSTDTFGLFTLTIGQGTNTTNGAQTSFADISWGTNTHYLKIEMDVTGGTNYSFMGTNQMMSVPYALYAENANIDYDSISTMISNDSAFIISVAGGMGGGGCDYRFPEGLDGDPQIIDLTQGDYTVPIGKNLYVLNHYTTNNNSKLNINGTTINQGAVNYENYHTLSIPIIVGSGQVVSNSGSSSLSTINAILINSISQIQPITIDVNASYTIPIGKNLYILNHYSTNNNSKLDINGITINQGAVNYENYHTLSLPIVVGSVQVVSNSGSASVATINGYLADENYFAACGGGGSSSSTSMPSGTNVGEMLYWDGNSWVTLTASQINGTSLTFCNGAPYWGVCYEIGDFGPGGGIVFYIDGNGGGLEAHDGNTNGVWGCSGTLVGTTTNFGDGLFNTNRILDSCSQLNIAALNISTMNINGYSDWYLPSKDEAHTMYTNLSGLNVPALAVLPSGLFSPINLRQVLTSSEYNANNAWRVKFTDGSAMHNVKSFNSTYDRVIAVRYF